jgi:hypothetical protein
MLAVIEVITNDFYAEGGCSLIRKPSRHRSHGSADLRVTAGSPEKENELADLRN